MDARASLRAFANCFALSQSSIFFTSAPSVEVALRRLRCSVSMGRDDTAPVVEVSKKASFVFPIDHRRSDAKEFAHMELSSAIALSILDG
ncbi:hypothetical protein IHE45_07G130700 [Dioscorea alata]|uniref:Uncharacterized protein n=1 Tax=Dioscorea alata TaxID=55571 RepID=A0ACB7VUS1_DIOAL|nr:hypothetical protein IHE45_07G130700 [Dioscorea alata]